MSEQWSDTFRYKCPCPGEKEFVLKSKALLHVPECAGAGDANRIAWDDSVRRKPRADLDLTQCHVVRRVHENPLLRQKHAPVGKEWDYVAGEWEPLAAIVGDPHAHGYRRSDPKIGRFKQ
jgi:hypothetical protein